MVDRKTKRRPQFIFGITPVLFAQIPAFSNGIRSVRKMAEFPHAMRQPVVKILNKMRIARFQLIPADLRILFSWQYALKDAFRIAVSKITMQLPVVTPDAIIVKQVQTNQISHHAPIVFIVEIFRAIGENGGVDKVCHAGVTAGTWHAKIFHPRDIELRHTANGA